ncbi:hypothetical protein CSB45_07345 [candidate division KSB3 bacterium]|uniref:Uncharacterized protein n=1 Tax=candidate division KSB3 bacterium TaxID=2044937 RepID=A0A2G6E5H6_9BACT|nr:MAG: hypothetical protein CSB45_07345 [candidate division KSB3 bacterium]PIE29851.1 MAG: hypothetical protein CSA57_06050 [candidate division KSB3 bacterium]
MIARIVRNVVSLLTGHLVSKIFSLLCIIVLAKELGVDGFGTYGAITASLTLFATFADSGLLPLVIREVSQNHEQRTEIFVHAFVLRMLLASVFYAAFCLGGTLYFANTFSPAFMMGAGLFLFPETIRKLGISMLSGIERMEIVAGLEILGSVVRYLPLLAAILLGLPLRSAFLLFVFAWGVPALVWLFTVRRYCGRRLPGTIEFARLRSLLYEAYPFGAMSILAMIYFKADILMLNHMQGSGAVGLYEAAWKFIEASMFVPVSLVNVLLPVMSRTFHEDRDSYTTIYIHAARILTLSVFPIILTASLFRNEIILLVYTQDYLPAASVLGLLLWSLFVIFLNAPLGSVIASSKHMHAFLPFAVGNTLVNIALNALLIPKYSVTGAGAATLMTECLSFIIHLHFIKKITGTAAPLITLTGKLLLLGIVSWLTGYFSISSAIFPLNILPMLGVYALAVFFLKLFDRQDQQVCREFLQKIAVKFSAGAC